VKLIIDSKLCEPPSQIYCFRDVTLYAKTFTFEDVLLECEKGTRSLYWKWLKSYGAHDFISQLLTREEKESGYRIGENAENLRVDRIDYSNYQYIISVIQKG
jgi:hypothetical protein